jgi:hypothetical protein
MAPGLASQDYVDLAALSGIGQQQQAQSQAEIDAEKAKYDYEQNIPRQKFQDYLAAITGASAPYGTQTTTQSGGPGMAQQLLGGALGLGSMFASPFGNPFGWMFGGSGGS